MKLLYYRLQTLCLILCMCTAVPYEICYAGDGGIVNYSSVLLISEQTDDSVLQAFKTTTLVKIDEYFDRVVVATSDEVKFNRTGDKIYTDINNIVNFYLGIKCPDLEIAFQGFSTLVADQIIDMEQGEVSEAIVKTKLNALKVELNLELSQFVQNYHTTERDMPQPGEMGKLKALDSPALYRLKTHFPDLIDPETGQPISNMEAVIINNEIGERIAALIESNNELIALLSSQIIDLKEQMIFLKKENLDHQQEIEDLHARIQNLEEAILAIRKNGSTIDSDVAVNKAVNDAVVYFEKNSYEIEDQYKPQLNLLYGEMIANPSAKLLITGHADKSGNVELNERISRLRSQEVRNYLIKKGINKSRLVINHVGAVESSKEQRKDRKVVVSWVK